MKKLFWGIVLLAAVFLSACGKSEPKIPCNGVLDIDTGDTFILGDSKEKFDKAFGEPTKLERTSVYNDVYYSYAGEILNIGFDSQNTAVRIESLGTSNRFEFYDFSFDKPLNEIEGRYRKEEFPLATFYSRNLDESGNSVPYGEPASYHAFLVISKEGAYESYAISLLTRDLSTLLS